MQRNPSPDLQDSYPLFVPHPPQSDLLHPHLSPGSDVSIRASQPRQRAIEGLQVRHDIHVLTGSSGQRLLTVMASRSLISLMPLSCTNNSLCPYAMSGKGPGALGHSDCCLVQRAGHKLSVCHPQLSVSPSSMPVSAFPPGTRLPPGVSIGGV